MDTIQSKYEFVKNKTCPYCQTKIKAGADFIVCPQCGTPHHLECWNENLGCTTYGCAKNPLTENKLSLESEDVGNRTIEALRGDINSAMAETLPEESLITCSNCKSEIEKNSVYCKYCGFNIKENKFDEAKKEFEKEYKKRYEEKIGTGRKRFLLTSASILVLVSALAFIFYFTITKVNAYFSSDEYKIHTLTDDWNSRESKDIEKYRNCLTDDYEYYGKDGKKINLQEKIKRMEWTFKNYKDIEIAQSDFKIINDSTTTDNDKKVQFKENYKSDKFSEKGITTLRVYRGGETNGQWKIYREFFD